VVPRATPYVLTDLAREMADAGRSAEEAAFRAAVHALARPARGFLTADQAAEGLGIPVSTVEDWVERGTLEGGPAEGCLLVATESVERVPRVREALRALDEEGNPTPEEIRDLYAQPRR
jgi:hypothetical protein